MATVIRPARPNVEDGEKFARYFDVAGHGLMRWMIGKRFVTIIGKAFLEPGHDLSHQHAWFVESDGVIAGMVSGYSADDHKRSKSGPMFRAAGIRAIRVAGAWVLARPLFAFMDLIPEGDWYVQGVAVDAAFRGAGMGSLLLDHAEEVAAAAGAHRFALDVDVTNDAARRLYERRGMTIDATSPQGRLRRDRVHRMTKPL